MSKRHSTRGCGKNDDSVDIASPPLRRFRKTAVLNEDDLLSNQPDDCLVRIISFLDRDTLDSIRRVSQRMFLFADKFNHVKRQLQCISIVQTITGHIFYARLAEFPGSCFKYSLILKKETGEVRAKPVEYDECAVRLFEGPDDMPYDEQAKIEFDDSKSVFIPSRFYKKLNGFMEKVGDVVELRIWNVLIDAPFGVNCALFFAGKIRSLHLENTRLDYSVENKYLVQMLFHLKPIKTKINGTSSLICENRNSEIFTLHFLNQFSNLRSLQHLHIEQPPTARRHIQIDQTDLDLIRRFSHLVLHTLMLEPTTFVHLVNTHLSEPNACAHLEFRLSIDYRRPFYTGLTHFVNWTYNDDEMEKVLTFGRIDNENSARIVYKPFEAMAPHRIEDHPIVQITLFNNQRWMHNDAQ